MAQSSPVPSGRPAARGEWSRVFGYDIFISFALGPEPRGCRAYASDLARRLRENGFTVFFSEDEAPAGSELDRTLRRALHRSRLLVVIVNAAVLAEPRWVRLEVEEYRRKRPGAAVIPIDIGGALRDADAAPAADAWLNFRHRIWIDESVAAWRAGQVSDDVIARLVTAPHALRSRTRLRIALAAIIGALMMLSAFAWQQRTVAVDQRDRALEALLSSATQQALLLARDGRAREGWNKLVEALAAADPDVTSALPAGFLDAALTTLVEDRRGPDLKFDTAAGPAPTHDDNDGMQSTHAFDATGARVAVSVQHYLAVWATADGRRLTQVRLPFAPETLTFVDGGRTVIAEGAAMPAATRGGTEAEAFHHLQAAAIAVDSGQVAPLPLALCAQDIPCIGEPAATAILPLAQLPPFARLRGGPLTGANAYLASAAGNVKTLAVSQNRFVLTLTVTQDEHAHHLTDVLTGTRLPLDGLREGDSALRFALARDVPLLAVGSWATPLVEVYDIAAGGSSPRLAEIYGAPAQLADATNGLEFGRQGKTLRYQNFRYGTGPGVGIGRTVVIDLATGAEKWARGEGTVVWGDELTALQEDWVDTQVISAASGATVFAVPGQPLGIDPGNRMMLMLYASEGPWPDMSLVEMLPVKRFAADTRGPASMRSSCPVWTDLRFVTLAERLDRLWNRHDWHRVAPPQAQPATRPAGAPAAASRDEQVTLDPVRNGWKYKAPDGTTSVLGRADIERRFPALAWAVRDRKPLYATRATSPDGEWHAVTIDLLSSGNVAGCTGISHWQLFRRGERKPVRTGCTAAEQPTGSEGVPSVSFTAADKTMGTPMTIALPIDVCTYEVMVPDWQATYTVHPAFSNRVSFTLASRDLLAIRSQDWYGTTKAYQLQQPGTAGHGPVFVMAERNDGSEEGAARPPPHPHLRELYPAATADTFNADAAFQAAGTRLRLASEGGTAVLAVPPWGERLRALLREAVQRRARKE